MVRRIKPKVWFTTADRTIYPELFYERSEMLISTSFELFDEVNKKIMYKQATHNIVSAFKGYYVSKP